MPDQTANNARRPRIVVVGSFNTDLVARSPRMPVPGETVLGGPFYTGPGGKGGNQAVCAARLGAEVSMVCKLGRDLFGDEAESNFVREGIRPDFILRTSETHTGAALIIVDDAGENMIVVASGANMLLAPEDIDAVSSAIVEADMLLVQLEVPLETVERAVRIAHEANVRVVLNPAPGQVLRPELLAMVDVLTPNETEARVLSGQRVTTIAEAEAAGRRFLADGVKVAVITLGSQGALVVTSSGAEHVVARPVEVVDTTGAGDAFSAALVVALAERRELTEAVAFANATAGLSVTKVGTAPAMPRRAEVDAFLSADDRPARQNP